MPKKTSRRPLPVLFSRCLRYLSIYLFIIVVYSGALITNYLLLSLVAFVLREDIARFPVVSQWFDYARIGLAALVMIQAVTLGIVSTVSQMKFDVLSAGELDGIR